MKIIFVCTGNTCRSPIAAAYLNSLNIPAVSAESRGLCAHSEPVSANSAAVMSELGIDISSHISKQFTENDLNADMIICMSASHYRVLSAAGAEHLQLLAGGISDPYGGSLDIYRACRDEIIRAIDGMLDRGELTPFAVSPLLRSDISDAIALEEECFSEPWTERGFNESLDAGTHFFKATADGAFAGYAGISAVADEGYITNIAVKSEMRGKGAASQLISRILRLARKKRLAFVSLEVRRSNKAAQAVYKDFGFVLEGERRGFYRLPDEDALIYTKRFE